MPDYFLDVKYNSLTYAEGDLNFKEFECCRFSNCNFSKCLFVDVTFIDCIFDSCTFTDAKINYVALRNVTFDKCEIKDVNFAMCDKLLFEVTFRDCALDFSKFYTLRLKGTTFSNCSLVATDFMNADLTEVLFENCDLYRSEFAKAIANKTNFKTSFNYTIDPKITKLKKAIFSLKEIQGLLYKYDIVVQ